MATGTEPVRYRSIADNVTEAFLMPVGLAIVVVIGALPAGIAFLAFESWETPRAVRNPDWMGEAVALLVAALVGALAVIVLRALRGATIVSEHRLRERTSLETAHVPLARIHAVEHADEAQAVNVVVVTLDDGRKRRVRWPSVALHDLESRIRAAPETGRNALAYPDQRDGPWLTARAVLALAAGACVVSLLFGVQDYGAHVADRARTAVADAAVVGVEIHDPRSESPETETLVAFTARGRPVEHAVWRPGAADIEVEDRVPIEFAPDDPTNAEFADIPDVYGPGIRVVWSVALVVGVVCAVGVLVTSVHLHGRAWRAARGGRPGRLVRGHVA